MTDPDTLGAIANIGAVMFVVGTIMLVLSFCLLLRK